VVLGLGLLQPLLWRWVSVATIQLQQNRFQDRQIGEVRSRSKAAEQELIDKQVLVEQLAAVAPAAVNTLQVIERMERMAAEYEVLLEIASIEESEAFGQEANVPVQQLVKLLMTTVLIGEPAALLSWLDAVEHMPELSEAEGMRLTYASQSSAWRMDVRVLFYMQK